MSGGWHWSEESRERLATFRLGRKMSPESKEKISQKNKGRIRSEDFCAQCRERRTGQKHSLATRRKMSSALMGNTRSLGNTNMRGRTASLETRTKQSLSRTGELNPRWRGGISKNRRYPLIFNAILKSKIRDRSSGICALCGDVDTDRPTFNVHHINYDPCDNREINLILLCRSCHMKTNVRREEWSLYLHDLMLSIFPNHQWAEQKALAGR